MHAGSIVFTVFSRLSSNEPHRRICASIGVAIPEDMESHWGDILPRIIPLVRGGPNSPENMQRNWQRICLAVYPRVHSSRP
ncbi:pyruvoyl-dependent arginine decarboxylase [Methanogenium cariaci]|uniref:pyruvoyl-dependent arginine decarboxylase n=1 Tax=Methanogenium cariaci TaxID=2197 RepID=UPI0024813821|nr:pyruvoyl-dependent arginine decarboxylase [Methanogenium cariaci]